MRTRGAMRIKGAMKLWSFAVCVVVMLLLSPWAQDALGGAAQPPAKAGAPASGSLRPRIGLVLEGGGALGLAHVGVIKRVGGKKTTGGGGGGGGSRALFR